MRIAVVLACLAVASTVGAKELIVRERSSTFDGQMPEEQTVYIAADAVVTESGATRTIVDLRRETITTVDRAARAYSVISFAELQAQMDALRKVVDTMAPDVRAKLDALFDDGGAVTLEPTGKTETIATYPAKEYTFHAGAYGGFVWATDAVEKPAAFGKWKALEKSRGGAARRLGEALQKVPGFPLRSHIEATGAKQAIVITTQVLEVREGSPPAELLGVPAGFTKRDPPAIPKAAEP